jgi:hypothetical protein
MSRRSGHRFADKGLRQRMPPAPDGDPMTLAKREAALDNIRQLAALAAHVPVIGRI